jgi:hypothetical protein
MIFMTSMIYNVDTMSRTFKMPTKAAVIFNSTFFMTLLEADVILKFGLCGTRFASIDIGRLKELPLTEADICPWEGEDTTAKSTVSLLLTLSLGR